jgi:uncharacterized protein
MHDKSDDRPMVDVSLGRIVIHENALEQFIFLREVGGARSFSIVIGTSEAWEIRRVVMGLPTERPLTHQLAHDSIRALGGEIARVDIVDLKKNTFFAQLVLRDPKSQDVKLVDARPSDAVALALRAGCPMRVAESVLEMVRTDESGPDPLPGGEQTKDDPTPGTS